MTELGVGYLSIVADTSRIPGQINSALGGAQASATSAGESMGSKLASGIGKTLKVGVAAAGVAAGGLLASSIHKGLGRLSAIDDAQGKLTSLGNSTAETAKIMDSALAAVKGTSYGLGDAATIAASAVAAGVKPGQDLTRYLGLTADAASIAGVSLSEMGQIINKVQTSGTAYTMEITQLADRGLPIWQWLATEMKKPQAEMKKLVAEGKVDSATYLRAIENNIGGAATAATTVSSAWANLGAAQGRFGATVAGPIFRQAIPAFTALTKAVDELDTKAKPVMATFEKNLTGKYIPAMLEFGNQGKEAFDKFRNSDFAVQSMSQIGNIIDQLVETGKEVGPAVGSIATSLSTASAALGVSTWQIFLTTLDASAQILNSTLVPVLNVTAGLMENNQGAVIGLAAAFLAFKTIPAIMGRIAPSIMSLNQQVAAGQKPLNTYQRALVGIHGGATGAIDSVRGFGQQMQLQSRFAEQSGRSIGRVGAAMAVLETRSPAIARMGDAYRSASSNLDGFSRRQAHAASTARALSLSSNDVFKSVDAMSRSLGHSAVSSVSRFGSVAMGTGAAGLSALRTGVSGVVNALGGPFSVAMMAATIGVVNYQSGIAKANNQNRLFADSAANAATAQGDLLKAMIGGSSQNDITAQVVQNVRSLRQEQQSLANTGPSMMQKSIAGWDGMLSVIGITRGETEKATLAQRDNADASKGVTATLDKLKLSNETVAVAVSGSALAYNKLRDEMLASGEDGKDAANWLARQRDEYWRVEAAMRRIGPAGIEIASAIDTLSDSASTSTDRLGSMKQMLIGLGLIKQSASDALFGFHEELDKVAESAEGAYLAANGLGDEMLDAAGKLDPANKNAQQLHETLTGLKDNMWAAAEKGNDANELFAAMGGTFDDLAKQTGFSADELKRMFLEMAGSPDAINIGFNLKGADEARQVITTLSLRADELAEGKPINMVITDEDARNTLRDLGLKVEEVKNGAEGEVRITADNEVAMTAMQLVFDRVGELDAKEATPSINADSTVFRLEDEGVRQNLAELRGEVADPKIGAILDDFIAGRDVTLRDLQDIDARKVKPEVILAMQQALIDAKFFSDRLDEAVRRRTATIDIRTTHTDYWESRGYSPSDAGRISGPVPVPGGYTGMRVPGYEGGGKLPTTGPGTDTVDGILGVDSWGIPTARVNRGEWVINDRSSEKYNRELASINAGTFPKLPGYETGGVVGSRDLTDFVTGRTSLARPLTGAEYDFGGVNWGDCSGAMSAIARFAVGLAPFAARFATGNMASALSAMGFMSGRGGPGDLRFGWYNGGPYGGHTAGTLADGTNVEMGGGYGGGMVGGSVGSNHSSFTNHAFLPIRASAARGGVARVEWTDKDRIELEAAEIAVRKAEEARTKVENDMAEGKKTQTDLDDANNKVEKAQEKLTTLQGKKDGIVDGSYKAPAPQAPALARMFTDSEIERIDAQLAVQSANERRNEVYDNPESTDADISKADAELYKAEKALRELGTPKAGDGPTSWSGVAGEFAKAAASGFVSDALGVFGVPDEMPPAIQAMRMFDEAQKAQAPYLIEPSADERAMGAQVTTSPTMIAQDSPAIYNPAEGIARWGDSVARGQDGVGALLEEIERIRNGNRYANGGPVVGPGGTDNVPAWLQAREFVVNALDANAGQNPAILQAMNNGARFSVDQGGRGSVTNVFNGIQNPEDVIKRLRVKEMQDAASHGWGPR